MGAVSKQRNFSAYVGLPFFYAHALIYFYVLKGPDDYFVGVPSYHNDEFEYGECHGHSLQSG